MFFEQGLRFEIFADRASSPGLNRRDRCLKVLLCATYQDHQPESDRAETPRYLARLISEASRGRNLRFTRSEMPSRRALPPMAEGPRPKNSAMLFLEYLPARFLNMRTSSAVQRGARNVIFHLHNI